MVIMLDGSCYGSSNGVYYGRPGNFVTVSDGDNPPPVEPVIEETPEITAEPVVATKPARDPLNLITLALFGIFTAPFGCLGSGEPIPDYVSPDAGRDAETDSEVDGADGDGDTDVDGDVDTDGDTDTDIDADGDADTDTDIDADGDVDSDSDIDVDEDADTDTDTVNDCDTAPPAATLGAPAIDATRVSTLPSFTFAPVLDPDTGLPANIVLEISADGSFGAATTVSIDVLEPITVGGLLSYTLQSADVVDGVIGEGGRLWNDHVYSWRVRMLDNCEEEANESVSEVRVFRTTRVCSTPPTGAIAVDEPAHGATISAMPTIVLNADVTENDEDDSLTNCISISTDSDFPDDPALTRTYCIDGEDTYDFTEGGARPLAAGEHYYIKGYAVDGCGNRVESAVVEVDVEGCATPPEAVTVVSPANGARDVYFTDPLVFNLRPDLDSIRGDEIVEAAITVGTSLDADGNVVGTRHVLSGPITPGEVSFTPPEDFPAETIMFWQVEIADSCENMVASPVWSFTTALSCVTPPNPFHLLSPLAGDSVELDEPFRWELVHDPDIDAGRVDELSLVLAWDDSAGHHEVPLAGDTVDYAPSGGLPEDSEVTWSVTAYDADREGCRHEVASSEFGTFRTRVVCVPFEVTVDDFRGFDGEISEMFNLWMFPGAVTLDLDYDHCYHAWEEPLEGIGAPFVLNNTTGLGPLHEGPIEDPVTGEMAIYYDTLTSGRRALYRWQWLGAGIVRSRGAAMLLRARLDSDSAPGSLGFEASFEAWDSEGGASSKLAFILALNRLGIVENASAGLMTFEMEDSTPIDESHTYMVQLTGNSYEVSYDLEEPVLVGTNTLRSRVADQFNLGDNGAPDGAMYINDFCVHVSGNRVPVLSPALIITQGYDLLTPVNNIGTEAGIELDADIPAGTSIVVRSRTSPDGSTWSPYVRTSEDGTFLSVRNQFLQVDITLGSTNYAYPVLRGYRIHACRLERVEE